MRDEIKADEIDEQRRQWPRRHGGFNACFFVEFALPAERWVVRFPIPVSLPKVILDEKTDIEVATMRYVSAKTTIPVPKIHAYAFSDAGFDGLFYIIMDYADGLTLEGLDFKASEAWGNLIIGGDQTPMAKRSMNRWHISTSSSICVRNRPLSMEVALQDLDGLQPEDIFPSATFSTTGELVDRLLRLADNKVGLEY
ncbi:hypothetical protein C8A05DRAFT_33369 [Staphylotrichum tortipilum]|uniref:Aminoglycoside phosphotransferase domain-containing protein n=1 Tax=Staphylotrichum tortipilum TaxID=2831512 RepID=A0AAN6MMA9_9PEZI|nr:hypothetical protein C8A05DRAFT_33369 [Staphylotrichum longicolle]